MIKITGDIYLGSTDISIEASAMIALNSSSFLFANLENAIYFKEAILRNDRKAILSVDKERLKHFIDMFDPEFLFGLGNNHINDLGHNGLVNTKEQLDKMEIKHTGAGLDVEVQKPLVINDQGKSIAFLTLSSDLPEVMAIVAQDDTLGVLDYEDPKVIDIIQGWRKNVDYFVVIPHWGREYLRFPAYHLRKRAYQWIEAGADLIVGHHPHVIQGREIYRGKMIYYSLGNFIFYTLFPTRRSSDHRKSVV